MRCFIAGATGVLGRRLVRGMAASGFEVVGIARTPSADGLIRSLGGRPSRVSLFDERGLATAMEGADVVIHAATSIPSGSAARFRFRWNENDRIRREGTRALATAAAAAGVRHLLQQGVAWVVPPGREGPYDEGIRPDPPALVRSSVEGEEIAREIGARHGMRVGVLRGGVFYGPEATRPILGLLRRRWMPVPGAGEVLKAPIHEEDMASAFIAAARTGAEGVWHVVDDQPVSLARLLGDLARVVGAPGPRHIPMRRARLLMGSAVLESLTAPMNTSNTRIRRELGWAPSYPTYRDGIAQMVETWRQEALPLGA